MWRLKRSETLAKRSSLAVILRVSVVSVLGAVPVKAPLPASKVSQLGRAAPSAWVAERVIESPLSTSAKLLSGIWKKNERARVTSWSVISFNSVGASLLLRTVTSTSSRLLAPLESVAVTNRAILPTSLLLGVPLKRPVSLSNESQVGSVVLLSSGATLKVKAPEAKPLKVDVGTW